MADHKAPIDHAQGQADGHHTRQVQPPQPPADPQAERRVHNAIAAASSLNAELLSELQATADAPGQLNNNEIKQTHAEKRLTEVKQEVRIATTATELQFKKHKKYRDSVAKKLVYTLASKKTEFQEKAKQEEDTYLGTLEKRRKAEQQLTELDAEKVSLVDEAKTLSEQVRRHAAAHEEIDKLYRGLFDGPTPGFPDEDSQEALYRQAVASHERQTEVLKSAVRGVKAVGVVGVAIGLAQSEKSSAAVESRSSLCSLRYVDSRLKRCIEYADRGLELSNSAVVGLPQPLAPILQQAKDIVDRFFYDVKITARERPESRSQAAEAAEKIDKALKEALQAQKQYLEEVKSVTAANRVAIRGTARSLENERQSLQQIRQSLFETTVGFGAAAPAYHECCDRAEGFESNSNQQSALIEAPIVQELPDLPPPDYERESDTAPADDQVPISHTGVPLQHGTDNQNRGIAA
ncbi:Fc.00g043240.m01.CDS01 [Cosmosporella sp. VM-42]